ncbi:hypothetical protein K493DRAFT_301247 [Basidiobolus meristosporus CBS 931.73]|uniref:Uncharacterized protein n=1 Tax=Basidiobolus meristosporus CBS 931.73 TaxID=1314790 RepID=A0A1Y1YCP7_9FUNG|nr:hypothetical protein K493DRAFT_301247 [Basidiobolus meristosporus CBS 931.73]|eukprot:ORX95811.1 hypothetical protein K493DRAFT_301247 [Basidiobolus meristosporus CBS 931.73]
MALISPLASLTNEFAHFRPGGLGPSPMLRAREGFTSENGPITRHDGGAVETSLSPNLGLRVGVEPLVLLHQSFARVTPVDPFMSGPPALETARTEPVSIGSSSAIIDGLLAQWIGNARSDRRHFIAMDMNGPTSPTGLGLAPATLSITLMRNSFAICSKGRGPKCIQSRLALIPIKRLQLGLSNNGGAGGIRRLIPIYRKDAEVAAPRSTLAFETTTRGTASVRLYMGFSGLALKCGLSHNCE